MKIIARPIRRLAIVLVNFVVVACSVFGLVAELEAQEGILKRIPNSDVVYLWTDDFRDLVQRSEELFVFEPETWKEAIQKRPIGEQDRTEKIESFNRESIAQMFLFLELWGQLRSGHIFDGRVIFTSPISKDGTLADDLLAAVPGTGEAVLQSGPIFLAETSASEDEMEAFLAKMKRLNPKDMDSTIVDSQSTSTTADDEGGPAAGSYGEGHWRIKEGWFCWTIDEEITDFVLKCITGELAVKEPLDGDRTFQTVMRSLKTDYSGESYFSFFVPGKVLPHLFANSFGNGELIAISDIDADRWSKMYFDEIRGFGGRVFVSDKSLDESLTAPVIVDSFLLCTQPRAGWLKAIPQNPSTSLAFDLPLLAIELSSFSQFAINGNGLAEGSMDSTERQAASRGEELSEEVKSQLQASYDLLREFTHFAEFRYDFGDQGNGTVGSLGDFGIAARANEIETVMAGYRTFESGIVAVPVARLKSPYNKIEYEGAMGWIKSDEAIDERVETIRKDMEGIANKLQVLQNDDSPEAKQERAKLESMIKSLNSRIEFEDRQRGAPQVLQFGNWGYVASFFDAQISTYEQGLIVTGEVHPQIEHLKQSVKNLKTYLRIERNQFALFAAWPERWIAKVISRSSTRRDLNEKPTVDDETSDISRWQQVQELAAKQFQELIIVGTNYEAGVRVSGALIRTAVNEEANEEDADESRSR